jgi:hypothetical protein
MTTNIWQKLTDLTDRNQANEEMVKKFKDTIVRLVIGGKNFYCLYRGYGANGNHHFNDEVEGKIELHEFTEYTVETIALQPGFYPTSVNLALYAEPLPNRQWKKGLCRGNTYINHVSAMLYSTSWQNSFQHLWIELVKNLDRTETYSIAQAVQQLEQKKQFSHYLDRNFALCLNNTEETKYCLMFLTSKVANIDHIKKEILMIDNTFLQEVLDNRALWLGDYGVINATK